MERVDMSALNINDETSTFSDEEHTEESLLEISTTSMVEMDVDDSCETINDTKPRRSSRKRAPRRLETIKSKQQLKKIDPSSERNIEKYYLDKRVRLAHLSLETIFEEPQNGNVMTSRRFKRSLKFEPNIEIVNVNKMKAKKRLAKAKTFCGTVRKLKKKLPMDLLLEKLSCLDAVECGEQK